MWSTNKMDHQRWKNQKGTQLFCTIQVLILHEQWNMRKFCVKWATRLWNTDQKQTRRRNSVRFGQWDDTCVHHMTPKTKQQLSVVLHQKINWICQQSYATFVGRTTEMKKIVRPDLDSKSKQKKTDPIKTMHQSTEML